MLIVYYYIHTTLNICEHTNKHAYFIRFVRAWKSYINQVTLVCDVPFFILDFLCFFFPFYYEFVLRWVGVRMLTEHLLCMGKRFFLIMLMLTDMKRFLQKQFRIRQVEAWCLKKIQYLLLKELQKNLGVGTLRNPLIVFVWCVPRNV